MRPTPLQSTTSDDSLSKATIFNLLSNRRRRSVIYVLKQTDDTISVKALATRIAAWKHGVDPSTIEYDQRRAVQNTLRQDHLPKLAAHDLIEYDTAANVVAPTPMLADLEIYIEALYAREIPWHQYYLGLAGVSVAVLCAVLLDVPGFAVFDPLAVGVFTTTSFFVSGLIHHYYETRTRLGNKPRPPELTKRS